MPNETAVRRVLMLVEDNPDDVLLVRRALGKLAAPVRLVTAEHGDAAIEYLDGTGAFSDRQAHPLPDLVLLDLKLPRRSGHEVLAWVRQQPVLEGLPVVVLTSSIEEDDVRRAYRSHANSYLRKPVALEELAALLDQVHTYWMRTNIAWVPGQPAGRSS
jgi:CheY-like chemotaxis protein